MRKAQNDYAARNPEKRSAAKRRWERENPEKQVAYVGKRRSLKIGNGAYIITVRDERMLRSQPCRGCGTFEGLAVDHNIPLTRGGTHSVGNLVMLCKSCNSSKHNMTFIEWRYSTRPRSTQVDTDRFMKQLLSTWFDVSLNLSLNTPLATVGNHRVK